MSEYYNPEKTRNLYIPGSADPYPLSRVKIELFIRCHLCFWLDRLKGVSVPPGYPFKINSAIDEVVKREFDFYRELGIRHPLMVQAGLQMIPLKHPKMEEWRNSRTQGIRVLHSPTNFIVFGGVDDIWYEIANECHHIVDTKATAQAEEVTLDKPHHAQYKRQVEIYAQLLRWSGFYVSDTSYFLYYNGVFRTRDQFYGRMEFSSKIIPYKGDSSWLEPTLHRIKDVLENKKAPEASIDCDYCAYRKSATRILTENWFENA